MSRYIDSRHLETQFDEDTLYNGQEVLDMISEEPTADVIPISDGATNGEMFKTMFPNVSFGEFMDGIMILNNNECEFWHNWWDAPYKGEKE